MSTEYKLSIIMPVYNEEKTIIQILKKINKVKIYKEVIVISDGSLDKTNILLKNNKYLYNKVIFLEKNMGKGNACNIGINLARGQFTIIQDADLEYNPQNYLKIVDLLNKNNLVVYGSRVLKGGLRTRPSGLRPYFSMFANYMLTKISNILNGQNLTDAHTCYKAFYTETLQSIKLEENGFGFCPEVTAKISKLGIVIIETSIDYYGRNYSDGKKIKLIHAFEALYVIFKYNYPYNKKLKF